MAGEEQTAGHRFLSSKEPTGRRDFLGARRFRRTATETRLANNPTPSSGLFARIIPLAFARCVQSWRTRRLSDVGDIRSESRSGPYCRRRSAIGQPDRAAAMPAGDGPG